MNKQIFYFLPMLLIFQNNSMDHRKGSKQFFKSKSHRTLDDMRDHKRTIGSQKQISLKHEEPFHLHLGSPFPKGMLHQLPLVIITLLGAQAALKMMPPVAADQCDGSYEPKEILRDMKRALINKNHTEALKLSSRYKLLTTLGLADGEEALVNSKFFPLITFLGSDSHLLLEIPLPDEASIRTQFDCIEDRIELLGTLFMPTPNHKGRKRLLQTLKKGLGEKEY